MENITDYTKQIFAKLKAQDPSGKSKMPPPFMNSLGMNYVVCEPGKHAKVSFPIKEAYNNPFGITFGGYFSMFFDAAFGPFSGLTAQAPTTSLDLNVTFLKSLSPKDEEVFVEVEVVSQTKSYLVLHGKALKKDGTLVATASSRLYIMKKK